MFINVMTDFHLIFCDYRRSAAHGNFRFIGPALTMMCHSIREKVLSLNGDNKHVETIDKGHILVYYILYVCVRT